MSERPEERVARHIVPKSLDVPVERYEDGLAPSQVDALIRYPAGDAALEIVGDHEAEFNAQWDALEKRGHEIVVEGLRSRWSVQMSRQAHVKMIRDGLPGLMLDLQDAAGSDRGWRGRALPAELAALGILALYPIDGEPVGQVNLHVEGFVGWEGSPTLSSWVAHVLAHNPDVPAKLLAHDTAEKHAFIWATIASPYSVQKQLADGHVTPSDPLTLPDGVTHVWVAGSFKPQGCLAWFPDRGWWRPWTWPTDTPLILYD